MNAYLYSRGKVMNLKSILFAVTITLAGAASAQQAIPPALQTAMDQAAAQCRLTPSDCSTEVSSVISLARALGIDQVQIDRALISFAATLVSVGVALPAAQQAQIASVLQTLADNISDDNTQLVVLNEIVDAFEAGEGAGITAQLASAN